MRARWKKVPFGKTKIFLVSNEARSERNFLEKATNSSASNNRPSSIENVRATANLHSKAFVAMQALILWEAQRKFVRKEKEASNVMRTRKKVGIREEEKGNKENEELKTKNEAQ